MVEDVLRKIRLEPGAVVLELYCGVGLYSLFLAGLAGKLTGVESSPVAGEDFAFNLDEFDHVDLYESQVEDVLGSVSMNPQVILLDPPRSGVGRQGIEQIAGLGASQILYISCDPVTLARDAKDLLRSGYDLREITPYDMFPQTGHIESLSIWEKVSVRPD